MECVAEDSDATRSKIKIYPVLIKKHVSTTPPTWRGILMECVAEDSDATRSKDKIYPISKKTPHLLNEVGSECSYIC
jgi:hypothetical protein